ncbi:response regulator [Falsibacillus albus]|uniref:Response regulator n=1 Tax=Falsibacillus albus TaxID=2478915 RepID=A0A3L7JU45_9BACI|nr:response regulator [Falsibacillus albus]RLQ93815.1 response regulator [Falsibacillus albus]
MLQVLIVEDDPMVAQINRKYLESIQGFACVGTVQRAADGLAFIEKTPVDLVLLDLFMPGKNGLELLINLRKKHSRIDVMVISAASDMDTIKSALRLGAIDYLIKPFEFERFQTSLMQYKIDRALSESQKEVSQEELDKLIRPAKMDNVNKYDLPKGITVETLRKTVEEIETLNGEKFSTSELAALVGISRVSMRKYLSFLKDINFISLELDYGSAGRPINRYQFQEASRRNIDPYIQG